MSKEESAAQMAELGFVSGGKFHSLIQKVEKPELKQRDFQYVRWVSNSF